MLQGKLQSLDVHTLDVIKKSSASTLVKIGGMAIGLLTTIALGRLLGAERYGIIDLSFRVVNILIVVGLIGMQQVVIKEVAIAHNKNNWKHVGNVLHTTFWFNGGTMLLLSVIFILLSPWLAETVFNEPRLTFPLIIAFVVMAPMIISRILSSALIGYHKIWQSNLVDRTLSIAVTGLLLLLFWFFNVEITVNLVAILYAVGRIAVTVVIGSYWKSLYKHKLKKEFITKFLLKTSMPLFLITISTVVMANSDAIMIGWLGSTKDVGLYSIAAKIALLTSFFLQVTNAAVAPKIAALYAANKIPEMEKMVQRVTLGLLVIASFPVIIYAAAGQHILNLWGSEFTAAYWMLVILSLGQLINIGTGASGLLLTMCGYERIHAKISFFYVLLNLILNYFFIINYGAIGAAIATAITVTFDNLTRVYYAKTKVGVLTFPNLFKIK